MKTAIKLTIILVLISLLAEHFAPPDQAAETHYHVNL
jgi:hypothetical protein